MAIVVLLIALVVGPIVVQCFEAMEEGYGRRITCAIKMRNLFTGLRIYTNSFDEFLPWAWHVSGSRLADDLSNLTYYRALLCEFSEAGFRRFASPGADPAAAQRQKFADIEIRWTDPVPGWTRDYFSSEIIFRMPGPAPPRNSAPVQFLDLTERVGVSASDRPFLADVNASLPNPDARDRRDPEHEAEMRGGFSFVKAAGIDVFVGVGPSLRRTGDCSTTRFDFRHSRGVNVLFLDGHVDRVKAADKARLERIYLYWNTLNPKAAAEKAPGERTPP